jgi:hypothetical protein
VRSQSFHAADEEFPFRLALPANFTKIIPHIYDPQKVSDGHSKCIPEHQRSPSIQQKNLDTSEEKWKRLQSNQVPLKTRTPKTAEKRERSSPLKLPTVSRTSQVTETLADDRQLPSYASAARIRAPTKHGLNHPDECVGSHLRI